MRNAPTRRSIVSAAPIAVLATTLPAAAASQLAGTADPVLAQIELHKALRLCTNRLPGNMDDPADRDAHLAEEAAIQALGDMRPVTVAGAAAQLAYMAEIEGDFADKGSPLLRTVLSVAQGLASLQGRSANA